MKSKTTVVRYLVVIDLTHDLFASDNFGVLSNNSINNTVAFFIDCTNDVCDNAPCFEAVPLRDQVLHETMTKIIYHSNISQRHQLG